MTVTRGIFVTSLDFELYWGIRDKQTIQQYEENLLGVYNAVQQVLDVFKDYGIHATWATVGFLFFESIDHLKQHIPNTLPNYVNSALSPYKYISESKTLDKAFHFAPELIKLIHLQPGQEIGTHTFSHYYCLEAGQSFEAFKDDISSAIQLARSKNFQLKSLIFPRNQCNSDYLSMLHEMGISCYRGNERHWIYKAANGQTAGETCRVLRLLDTYFNFSGYHTYSPQELRKEKPFNIPSSRFLRPYSKRLSLFDPLRLRRITKAMDDAALNHKIFHIWWHPHNFGSNTEQNIVFLKKILNHFRRLQEHYGMSSLNMGELSDFLDRNNA